MIPTHTLNEEGHTGDNKLENIYHKPGHAHSMIVSSKEMFVDCNFPFIFQEE